MGQNIDLKKEEEFFRRSDHNISKMRKDNERENTRNKENYFEKHIARGRDQFSHCYKTITIELFDKLEDHISSQGAEGFNIDMMFEFFMAETKNQYSCCAYTHMNFDSYVRHCENYHSHSIPKRDEELYSKGYAKENKHEMKEYMTKISKNHLYKIELKKKLNKLPENENGLFVCEFQDCGKQYTSINGLKYHFENMHMSDPNREKGFKCTYENCDKKYKNANGLQYHIKVTHYNEKDEQSSK